jgi:hypothetical protein
VPDRLKKHHKLLTTIELACCTERRVARQADTLFAVTPLTKSKPVEAVAQATPDALQQLQKESHFAD